MTLIILAAGMGSRFGGLKQIEPIGPHGEFIIDYSIYDAIKAGFKKVVFVIKEENYEVFKETIGNRISNVIEVSYVFQDNKVLPNGFNAPSDRIKPLGTAHALYCAKNEINGPFAIISADDFYGREPFELLNKSLITLEEFSAIGFQIKNTMSKNGSVKRGVIFTDGEYLDKLVESKVDRVDGKIMGYPLNGDSEYEMEEEHPVSMLMFGLQYDILNYLEGDFVKFLEENKNDLSTCEYYLPDLINSYLNANDKRMKILPTKSIWKGITYQEDLEELKQFISEEIERGVYPVDLY